MRRGHRRQGAAEDVQSNDHDRRREARKDPGRAAHGAELVASACDEEHPRRGGKRRVRAGHGRWRACGGVRGGERRQRNMAGARKVGVLHRGWNAPLRGENGRRRGKPLLGRTRNLVRRGDDGQRGTRRRGADWSYWRDGRTRRCWPYRRCRRNRRNW